jgi:4'-phosphopantetheinyl transferase
MTDTIALWYGELTEQPASITQYWPMLNDDEQARAQQFKLKTRQDLFVLSRGLLRKLLAETVHDQPQQIRLANGQYGKPYCLDYPELAFNLSHTGNHLMLAIARNCQLGVDIELIKPRLNLPGLVGKCFSNTEADYWHQLSEQDQLAEFYRFWTGKEAFVKATGRGISLGMQHCELSVNSASGFITIPEEYGDPEQWSVQYLQPNPFIYMAVVTDRPNINHSKIELLDIKRPEY